MSELYDLTRPLNADQSLSTTAEYDLTRPLGLNADPGVSVTAEIVVPTLTGYTFLTCVERSPLGEMWKVRGPDETLRVAYYLRVGDGAEFDGRLDRLRLFEHPDILSYDIVEGDSGRMILLTEGYDLTLQERFQQLWSHGQSGIPRHELLDYLRGAASALDTVHKASGLQHLGLSPATLWVKDNRVRVGGFGLIQLLWLPTGRPATELNGRYAAPELGRGHVSRRCDQYSLALIFAELLTGVHPVEGPARRRQSGRSRKLDLSMLSSADQAALGRALDPKASLRFASCTEFVQALEAPPEAPPVDPNKLPAALPSIIPASEGPLHLAPSSTLPSTTLNQFIMELVAVAAGHTQLAQSETIRYRVEPGQSLEHRMPVQMFPGAMPLKLEGFRQQWKAQGVQQEPGRYSFTVTLPPDFWQRITGQRLGLEIQIELMAGKRGSSKRNEVAVVVRPFGCNQAQAARLLVETGPAILESVRTYLQACPEQRGQDRLAISQPLRVCPVLPDMQLAQPIECKGKDISTRGIGFFLPHPPSTPQVYINIPGVPQLASVAGLAQIVRGQPCGDGWYEVGAYFAGDGPGKSS